MKAFINHYFKNIVDVFETISKDSIEEFLNILLMTYQQEKQIFIMSNGGSASTTSHFACDLNKNVCLKLDKKFKVICLNDNIPTIMAYANNINYEVIFQEQLSNFLNSPISFAPDTKSLCSACPM